MTQKAASRPLNFAVELLRRAPAGEIRSEELSTQVALATDFFEFARQRMPGEPKLRLFNPESDKQGWTTSHTGAFEIVNDDMPFLVDSVVLALSELLWFSAHLIVHPVVAGKT